ncbi:iron-siderophore ABC transporter substrate-binding protein [Kribbella sp. NPDC056861]|uniref:iron-siderophore ABC transporter substrate-binding protein n=1 Tax=Kribbella sp. NPDC056861 TaxID=3154857 RepID=UPI003415F6FF
MFWSRTAALAAAALVASTALVACGSADDDARTPVAETVAGFPVTLKNTFGETTIAKKPERIVTLGWNAQDVVYALGESPVGMPKVTYGPTPAGTTAWNAEQFDPAKTTLLDTGSGIPFEKLAALRPDVILAPYEGFDKAAYTKLSEIAPTVAYPGAPWQTTWQDQTTIIGKALGKSAEADKLVAGIKELTSKAAAEHPEFKGKTLSILAYGAQNFAYMPTDPRVQILTEMGFVNSPGVDALQKSNGKKEFAIAVSKERLGELNAEVVVGYLNELTPEKFAADPVYASLPAFKQGTAYLMTDQQVISGMSSVSVLSVPWVLDKILPGLSKAAKATS